MHAIGTLHLCARYAFSRQVSLSHTALGFSYYSYAMVAWRVEVLFLGLSRFSALIDDLPFPTGPTQYTLMQAGRVCRTPYR